MGAKMNSLSQKICTIKPVIALLLAFITLTSSFVSSAHAYNLTLGNTGSGSGDINGTVTCTIGALGGCNTSLPDGTPVTLTANPDWTSIFEGWGAPCSGTGSCVFTLNADTLILIPFSPNYQAHLVSSVMPQQYYSTLAAAYADATAIKFNVVAYEYTFHENLILDKPIHIFFGGGRLGPGYLSHRDDHFTTILGSLEVQQGSVEIDSFIIQ